MANFEELDKTRPSGDWLKAANAARLAGDADSYGALIYMHKLSVDDEAKRESNPTLGMSGAEKAVAGFSQGVHNVGRHVGNLVPDKLGGVPDAHIKEMREVDRPLLETPQGRAGAFFGETVATAPLSIGSAGIARAAPSAARVLNNPIARGAIEGAEQGFITGDPGDRLASAAIGSGLGGMLPLGAASVGKFSQGMKRTPEADFLIKKGVDLTPGQMNPTGVVNQLEETATSLAGQGTMVKGARDKARDQAAQAALRTGAAPGANIPAGNASEMLRAADDSIKPLYDAAKGFPLILDKGKPVIVNAGANVPLGRLFMAAVNKQQFSPAARKEAQRFLENEFAKKVAKSDDLIAMRSAIRAEKRAVKSTATPTQDTRAVAEMLEEAEAAVTQALESQIPQSAAQSLKKGDAAYRQLAVLDDAAARGRRQSGELFTPAQLDEAVYSSMPDKTYNRMQPGQNELYDIAKAGRKTFEQKAPVTGARLLTLPGVPIARDALAAPITLMASTKTGRRLAAGTSGPQQVAKALSRRYQSMLSPTDRRALAAAIERGYVTGALQNTRVAE
jgi:hypothetical protein